MKINIKIRQIECGLVFFISIVPLLAASIFSIAKGFPKMDPIYLDLQVISGLILEIGSISLLMYILFKQNRSLSDLGFSFSKIDIAHSFGIALAAIVANYVAYYFFTILSVFFFSNGLPQTEFQTVLDSGFTMPLLIFIIINPFFEELIVRAYLITELEFFTNSAWNAGLFSIFIQISYHLYQGITNSLTMIGIFSVFTLYYFKKRRIWPIILAHAYFDFYSYGYHFMFQP